MIRNIVSSSLLLLLIAFAANAQTPPVDLKGKSLAATFDELLPGMGAAGDGCATRNSAGKRSASR